MEDKLIVGKEETMKKEKVIHEMKQDLERNKENQVKLAEELAKKEEEKEAWIAQNGSLKEKLEQSQRKLSKIFDKYQHSKQELEDQEDEFAREREYL